MLSLPSRCFVVCARLGFAWPRSQTGMKIYPVGVPRLTSVCQTARSVLRFPHRAVTVDDNRCHTRASEVSLEFVMAKGRTHGITGLLVSRIVPHEHIFAAYPCANVLLFQARGVPQTIRISQVVKSRATRKLV